MKYIKLYEYIGNEPAIKFKDEYLIVRKANDVANNGKILFKCYNEKTGNYSDTSSMMLGCAEILDTKYEHILEIREVTISDKFRKVLSNTETAIIDRFLKYVGYSKEEIRNRRFFLLDGVSSINLVDTAYEVKVLAQNSKNLGEVLDGLKIIREDFKRNIDINKYNL